MTENYYKRKCYLHETLLNITLQLINNKTAYTAQAAHTRARKALSLSKKKNITNRITKKNDTLSIDTCKRELIHVNMN